MDSINIIKQDKNPFLHREEILFEIQSQSAPSFEQVKQQLGKDEKLTVIKKISNNFGSHKFLVQAFVYESEAKKQELEKLPRAQAKKIAAQQPAAPAAPVAQEAPAAEQKPAEKPKEEKQAEETKTEEKTE